MMFIPTKPTLRSGPVTMLMMLAAVAPQIIINAVHFTPTACAGRPIISFTKKRNKGLPAAFVYFPHTTVARGGGLGGASTEEDFLESSADGAYEDEEEADVAESTNIDIAELHKSDEEWEEMEGEMEGEDNEDEFMEGNEARVNFDDPVKVVQEETVENAEYEHDGIVFQEEILVRSRVEEDDIRLVSGTTDGELADDEDMGSISTPEDSAELAAVAPGGAVLHAQAEEQVNDEGESIRDEVVPAMLDVEFAVSDEMKQILRKELKYTARDVTLMRPEIATMVVYNKLMRPIEGMPRNWYVDGAGPVGPLRENALKILVGVAAVSAMLAFSGPNGGIGDALDASEIFEALKKIPGALVSIPKKLLSVGKKATAKVKDAIPDVVKDEKETESEKTFSEQEMKEMEDEVPHSIKPGERLALTGKQDENALDRFISKIEALVKAFFSIKI